MSSIKHGNTVETKQLIEFSRIFAGFGVIVCAISFYRHGELSLFAKLFAFIGLAIGMSGIMYPIALTNVYRAWMWLGEKLAIVVSTVIVFVTFFLVITPVGLLLKLIGKDLLNLRFDKKRTSSYFQKPDSAAAGRHDTPF